MGQISDLFSIRGEQACPQNVENGANNAQPGEHDEDDFHPELGSKTERRV